MKASQITNNSKISGTYYGKRFTGRVIETRMNYRSYALTNVYIQLDTPVFHNEERTQIYCEVYENGVSNNGQVILN